jgi:hypothetical protein
VEFVAGHLVTRKAGGTVHPANLAPFTGDFNTETMRKPEIEAEKLLASGNVIKYESDVVSFGPFSLIAIIKSDVDRNLVAKELNVTITELGLKDSGDPAKIEDWTKVKQTRSHNPKMD